jgi:hypothetical protein
MAICYFISVKFGAHLIAAIALSFSPPAKACSPPSKPAKVAKSANLVGGCDGEVIVLNKKDPSRADRFCVMKAKK